MNKIKLLNKHMLSYVWFLATVCFKFQDLWMLSLHGHQGPKAQSEKIAQNACKVGPPKPRKISRGP